MATSKSWLKFTGTEGGQESPTSGLPPSTHAMVSSACKTAFMPVLFNVIKCLKGNGSTSFSFYQQNLFEHEAYRVQYVY